MKPLQLVALNLAARNITGKLEQFGDEFQILVTTIAELFEAEAVAKKLQERFGLTLYVALPPPPRPPARPLSEHTA